MRSSDENQFQEEMGYGQDPGGEETGDYQDERLPEFRKQDPVRQAKILFILISIAGVVILLTSLMILDILMELCWLGLFFYFSPILGILFVWQKYSFLKEMKLSGQLQGEIRYWLELEWSDRWSVRPQAFTGPIAGFVVCVVCTAIGLIILPFPINVLLSASFLMNTYTISLTFFKPRNYLLTDQGFAIFFRIRKPPVVFTPWSSFSGFSNRDRIIKLNPRASFIGPKGYTIEAGDDAGEMAEIISNYLPEES